VAHFSGAHGHSSPHFSGVHSSSVHGVHGVHGVHASHLSGRSHISHASHSNRFSGHTHATTLSHSNLSHANLANHASTAHNNALHSHVTPLAHAANPKNFGARRDFATKAGFQPFWHEHWHQAWWHHNNFFHIGWIGPLFWPYAYGDFFYYALWPWDYWYYDPFWAYGYGDIYQRLRAGAARAGAHGAAQAGHQPEL
jgi:hypothetical protein